MRREFTANVSHELKTPLTTIRGFAELMSEGMVSDQETLNKYAMLIKIESERLINLINDILRISELEETAIPVNLERVDLFEAARGVVELLQDDAKKRGIGLHLTGQSVYIYASKDSIKELLLNLADNAVKYNRENGKVDINVSLGNKKACIVVEDTGIGIPRRIRKGYLKGFTVWIKAGPKKLAAQGWVSPL